MAAQTTPYLFFNGNCKEAIGFYHSIFGGEAHVMKYGEAMGDGCPPAIKDQVMHANVKKHDNVLIMASDSAREAATAGNNVHIALNVDIADYDKIFKALSTGGKVDDAPQDAPWGQRFGTLTDKYGFHWMMTADQPKT